jgi:hypothetical protein
VLSVCFVDLVDRADVRVIQRGSSEGFPLKPFASSRIILQLLRKELQRDMTVQLEIFRFIHDAHPAAAQLLDDTVMGHDLADEGIGSHHWPNILCFVSSQRRAISCPSGGSQEKNECDSGRMTAHPETFPLRAPESAATRLIVQKS